MKHDVAFESVPGCSPALMVPIDSFFNETRDLKFPVGCGGGWNSIKPSIVWPEKCGI